MLSRDAKYRQAVLTYLTARSRKPVRLREIADSLGISRTNYRSLRRVLKSLIRAGEVCKTRSGLYGIPTRMALMTGIFEAHRDGYGFVLPDKAGERDLFIPPRKTSGAISGDRVVVRIEGPGTREGRIIKILERGQKRIVGYFSYGRNLYYVRPRDRRKTFDVYIGPKNRANAVVGDVVLVELISFPDAGGPPEGRILKVLAKEIDTPQLDIDVIVEEYSLTPRFPAAAIEESRDLVRRITKRGRVDCRRMVTVTIDGEMAQDFDDAVSIDRTKSGYRLWVHIADVSHYVKWDSALDLEARRRGTSVYFPQRVIPMLPEALSNDLCSLVPDTDRLTMTVEMHFDRKGKLVRKNFFRSVIHSDERMTYTSVRKILVDNDPGERQRYSHLIDDLETMRELCGLLRRRRMKRGSLDFDLPEPQVLLDIQGRPEAILRAERDISHMIIEEFMIAANEAVGAYLKEAGCPALFRVHEKPDLEKLQGLKNILGALGLRIEKADIRAFHRIIREARGTAGESIVNMIVLRSLKQAKYSTENIGHFGLASKIYTHFTSPIRRYPDLVVHRVLEELIDGNGLSDKKRRYLQEVLPDIAFRSSAAERVADEAEREAVNAMRVWFMSDKVGNEYEGIIIAVSHNGLRVRLRDFFVDGFLHISYLPEDYYRFDEKNYRLVGRHGRKTFTIGRQLRVRIERVDIEEREISLALV